MIRLYLAMGAFAAVGALVAFVYWQGINHERTKNRLNEAEGYRNERQAIDNADVGQGDPDVDRDWLRDAADRLRGPR